MKAGIILAAVSTMAGLVSATEQGSSDQKIRNLELEGSPEVRTSRSYEADNVGRAKTVTLPSHHRIPHVPNMFSGRARAAAVKPTSEEDGGKAIERRGADRKGKGILNSLMPPKVSNRPLPVDLPGGQPHYHQYSADSDYWDSAPERRPKSPRPRITQWCKVELVKGREPQGMVKQNWDKTFVIKGFEFKLSHDCTIVAGRHEAERAGYAVLSAAYK
ncbi:hypothetical protein MCOR08_005158 [Pyricularia oryzae]|nr:hypothetical protein MCOR08_005158 [Pyricularia oryzae]